VSPLAAGYAKSSGVDVSTITGTGPNGRIIKADIDDAIARGPATPATPAAPVFDSTPAGFGDFIDIENSTIRKVIADRLTYSK
jgi:pyruvate dehydrogenase E2 component (dihydrolipoamide acetyltransferase)